MSGHSDISKIISAAALLFTLAACTSTVQPRPHQRPASADPVPAPSSASAPPSPSPVVGVGGLVVDGHPVTGGQRVTITGPVAARKVSGRFTAAAPAGHRFFALTTPFTSASTAGQASYVQGEIVPGAHGSWSVTASIGADGRYPAHPDRVTIVLATPSVAATLASYEGQPGTLRPVDDRRIRECRHPRRADPLPRAGYLHHDHRGVRFQHGERAVGRPDCPLHHHLFHP